MGLDGDSLAAKCLDQVAGIDARHRSGADQGRRFGEPQQVGQLALATSGPEPETDEARTLGRLEGDVEARAVGEPDRDSLANFQAEADENARQSIRRGVVAAPVQHPVFDVEGGGVRARAREFADAIGERRGELRFHDRRRRTSQEMLGGRSRAQNVIGSFQ